MGYGVADLFNFLREVAYRPGVHRVLLSPYEHPAEILVEVEGGFSDSAYDVRQAIYELFEQEFADYRVRELLDVEYRIIPVGSDLSAPHAPLDAIEVRREGEVVAGSESPK